MGFVFFIFDWSSTLSVTIMPNMTPADIWLVEATHSYTILPGNRGNIFYGPFLWVTMLQVAVIKIMLISKSL